MNAISPSLSKMSGRKVTVHYGQKQALFDVNLEIPERMVTALIGPSGCGKSTFLRCLNRMNDVIEGCSVGGEIVLDGQDIYDSSLDVVMLRARIGMVFQKPNPFPKSIYDNVAYGPRIHGMGGNKGQLDEIVQWSLTRAGLERGQGPAGTARHRPFRRSAAASLHCPRDCGQPRSHPDGRALLGPRSHRHGENRGTN